MKEVKTKPGSSAHDIISTGNVSTQKHGQATEEQLRYAKLSQVNTKEESIIQEKVKEISEITRKPPDIISIALHDSNYDASLAIQNILEGRYDEDQGEWKTNTRKSKKPSAVSSTVNARSHSTTPEPTQKINSINTDNIDGQNQKSAVKPNRLSRGGGSSNARGRSSSRNWRGDDKTPSDERFDESHDREGSRERTRSSDRGRGRGRGRVSRGGGVTRGSRGGRGGFGRPGTFRGSSRPPRGSNRGGFSQSQDNKGNENGMEQTVTEEESWDVDTEPVTHKIEDWTDEVAEDNPDSNWSKGDWGDDPDPANNHGGSLFSTDVNWAQMNGTKSSSWDDSNETTSKDEKGKYIPENIDTAVIRSVPTSSTSGEVTSYQPTNDLSRYINTASNQFPSSHQEGGLTSSLNERTFSIQPSVSTSESVQRTVASMPIVSGVTESHKLEQEQFDAPKQHRSHKVRKGHGKYVQLPSQPVVMPRSAQMVNDIEEQFTGLEFGSGPINPRGADNISDDQPGITMPSLATTEDNILSETSARHSVATLQSESLLPQQPPSQGLPTPQPNMSSQPTPPAANSATRGDMPKTPPGFKPLDQNSATRYISSPGRGLMAPEPIPFPSSTALSSATPSTSLNVFSRNGGLGTSVAATEHQTYNDQQVYDQLDHGISADNVLAEQRALAEKQYMAEQRVLSEHKERERMIANQRAFAEQKSLAQQTLIHSQRSQKDQPQRLQDESARSERLPSDLSDRQNISNNLLGLGETSLTSTDPTKFNSKESGYMSNKIHGNSSSVSATLPPHGTQSYSNNASVSKEILGLTSATGVQTTAKTQNSGSKVSSVPPGMISQQMNMYPSVQPGMIPAYQHQAIHGYNYEDLLQMQRVPVPPYTYDVSMYPAAAAGAPVSTRDGLQPYQGADSKFTRGTDESSPVSLQQGNPHVAAAGNLTQPAYLNAGQIPFGYTYAYQHGVIPQGNVYPTFTAPSALYQVPQGKGVGATQFQSPYQSQQQGTYSSTKFSGSSGGHDYGKGTFQGSGGTQVVPAKPQHAVVSSSSIQQSTAPTVPHSGFKSQYNQDGKGYLGNSPTALNTQANMHLHNPAMGNMNHYMLQQQVGATHMGHQHIDPAATHRSQVHQVAAFNANQQQKRDQKGSYHSYWSGNR